MRKVLLVHISPSGCCNTLVTMLNNGDFGFPYCATPAFSTPAVWCRVFQSRVFSRPTSRRAVTPCGWGVKAGSCVMGGRYKYFTGGFQDVNSFIRK